MISIFAINIGNFIVTINRSILFNFYSTASIVTGRDFCYLEEGSDKPVMVNGSLMQVGDKGHLHNLARPL